MRSDKERILNRYILVKDYIDLGHAALGISHGSLSGYLEFENEGVTQKWRKESFRDVLCEVNEKEFEKAKTHGKDRENYRIMTESALDNAEVAIVFKPKYRDEWPKFFKGLRLFGKGR